MDSQSLYIPCMLKGLDLIKTSGYHGNDHVPVCTVDLVVDQVEEDQGDVLEESTTLLDHPLPPQEGEDEDVRHQWLSHMAMPLVCHMTPT